MIRAFNISFSYQSYYLFPTLIIYSMCPSMLYPQSTSFFQLKANSLYPDFQLSIFILDLKVTLFLTHNQLKFEKSISNARFLEMKVWQYKLILIFLKASFAL